LAHWNRNYIFQGGSIDARHFFRIRNLTRKVEKLLPKLTFQLRSELRVLAMPEIPQLPTGPHCTAPVVCEFFGHCNQPRRLDHIGYLPRIHASAMEELEEMGIESVHDIPEDFELTEIQRRAATCVQTGEAWISADLGEVFSGLTYPLYFMDFETVNRAIPPFPGMRPYDQLPFQFSVHSQKELGATLEHHEFLATDTTDPRREFLTSLCSVLGKSGSIIVYSAFESQRLAELAVWLPDFTDRIKNIQARLWDLLPIVRSYVYHPAFAGSYSIKNVLPALVPGMTYEGIEVADGTDAGLAWESLVRGSLDQNERNRIMKALLDYCGQDTLAMVRLLERLKDKESFID